MNHLPNLIRILKESDDWQGVEARPKVTRKEDIVLRYAAKTFYMPKYVERNSSYEDRTNINMYLDDTDDVLSLRTT
jgi:hypothetical protein